MKRTPSRERRKMLPPVLPPLNWPQHPVLWRFGAMHPGPDRYRVLTMNTDTMIPFESPLFKGYVHASVRTEELLPLSQKDFWADGGMWHGKRRRFVLTFTGRFKRRLKCSELYCGMEWDRQLFPPRGFGMAQAVGPRFCPGLTIDCYSKERPYLKNTLISFIDTLHHWRKGDSEEDRYKAGRKGKPMTAVWERGYGRLPNYKQGKDRAKALQKKQPSGGTLLDELYWETDIEYSFDFYTHVLHLDKMEIRVPLGFTDWPIPGKDYLGGNPMPIVCHTADGEYAFHFEFWHVNLLHLTDPEVLPASAGAEALEDRMYSADMDESTEISFHSCQDAEDIDSESEEDCTPGPSPPDISSPSIPPQPEPFPDGLGAHVVQCKAKRIRAAPGSHNWRTKKGEISVGTPVRLIDEDPTGKWARIQLPDRRHGWIKRRYLGPRQPTAPPVAAK